MPQKNISNGAAKWYNNLKICFLYFAKMHIFGKNPSLWVRCAKYSRGHRELKFSYMCVFTNWHVFDGAAKILQTKMFFRTTLIITMGIKTWQESLTSITDGRARCRLLRWSLKRNRLYGWWVILEWVWSDGRFKLGWGTFDRDKSGLAQNGQVGVSYEMVPGLVRLKISNQIKNQIFIILAVLRRSV